MDLEFKKGCSFEFNKHNLFLFNFQNIGFIDDLLMELSDRSMLGNWEIQVLNQLVSEKDSNF